MEQLTSKLARFKQWILSFVMPCYYQTNKKKVTIYLKSGNTIIIKCKKFKFVIDESSNDRQLEMIDVNKYEWMIDLSEIEGYTVNRCYF